jgi:hypothetical protein
MAITIQQRGLEEAIRTVRRIPGALTKASVKAVNQTAREARKFTAQAVYDSVMLKKADINQRLSVNKATRSNTKAALTAHARPRLLASYGARVRTAPVKHPRRSKGYAQLGIPPGRKMAGVSVKVKRSGSRKLMRPAFLLVLRSNNIGLAVRTGRGRDDYEIRYGPSVAQVVSWNDDEIEAFIGEGLSRTFEAQLVQALERLR